MTKFKVGDKVRLVDASGLAAPAGSIATVLPTDDVDSLTQFRWDPADHRQMDGGYSEDRFELVVEASTPSVTYEIEATSKGGVRIVRVATEVVRKAIAQNLSHEDAARIAKLLNEAEATA